MINFHDRRFVISHLVMPLLVMLSVLIAFEFTNWDVDFASLFYVSAQHKWLVSSTKGWIEIYLHDGGKTLTKAYGYLCIVGAILSFRKQSFKPYRKDFIFVALAVIFATAICASLKHLTNIYCPKQLTIFGGFATYVKVFDPRIPGEIRGVCWPSGHASAGFAFLSAYFVVLRRWPRYTGLAFLGGLGMGVLFGGVRMLQGQHFLSHTLWSGIICWVVIVIVAMAVFKDKPAT